MCAGFFVRLAAYLIDSLIVGIGVTVTVRLPISIASLVVPDNILVRDFIFKYSVADIIIYALGVAYFIILTYQTGATLGKQVLHIQVVSAEDRQMTLFEVIYRETIGRFLSALVLSVGYFMIAIHKEKRGLHDLMSDTKVIYQHKQAVDVESPIGTRNEENEYKPISYAIPNESEEEIKKEDLI